MRKINWKTRGGVGILDALHNCSSDEVGNGVYARGVLVGIMVSLIYTGHNFDEAWKQILETGRIDPLCIPQGWPTLADYTEAKK